MNERLLTREADPVTSEFVERVNRFVIRVDFGDEVGRAFLGDPGTPGHSGAGLRGPVRTRRRSGAGDGLRRHRDSRPRRCRRQRAGRRRRAGPRQPPGRARQDLFAGALDGGHLLAVQVGRRGHPGTRAPGPRPRRLPPRDRRRLSRGVRRSEIGHARRKWSRQVPDRQTERGGVTSGVWNRYWTRAPRPTSRSSSSGPTSRTPPIPRSRPRVRGPGWREVSDAGVEVHALVTAFDPPHYSLRRTDLPVRLDG